MKKEIDRRIRLSVIAILILLFGIFAYDASTAYHLPTEVTHDVTAFTYAHSGTSHYNVCLKPNSLYETTTIGENKTYFRKITERIDTVFEYEFIIDHDAGITGEYDVTACVASADDWEKCFTLVPKTTFNSSGTSAAFTESLQIDPAHYEEVLSDINDELGVRTQDSTLTIKYNIHTVARTDAGDVDESLTPSLVIPLNKNVFSIKNNADGKTGSIKTKKTIFKQNVVDRRRFSTAAAILTLILLIAFGFRTSDPKIVLSETEKEILSARKRYGDWIADAVNVPIESEQVAISLRSLDDLVKIAEELGKPIIQKTDAYYIFDGSIRYEYHLVVDEHGMETETDDLVG